MSVLRGVYSLVPLVTITAACGIGAGQSVFGPSFNPPPSSAKQTASESPANAAGPKIDCKAKFIMSLCQDQQGYVWAGSEDDGVLKIDLATGKSQQFTTKDGLGDDDVYAVACDRKGRIWVGHCNHGVSVWNGERWQVYEPVGGLSRPDTLSGPLGERVFAIKVCDKTGDVWICTNCGLSIYSESKDSWSYITRADGLPSDDCHAIAFDKDGNAYVGTACDGITMARAADDYKHWRTVTGPDQVPLVPAGSGLPTSLINDILVAKNGTIYAATGCGLAMSHDNGYSWQFVRGADWANKVRGLAAGPPAGWKPTPHPTLAEDYCTCLAEGSDGTIGIGHWRRGFERVSPQGNPVPDNGKGAYVQSAFAAGDGFVIGCYGNGVKTDGEARTALLVPPTEKQARVSLRFPAGKAAPDATELNLWLLKLAQVPPLSESESNRAVPLDDDRRTQGDWIGRRGRYWAVISAIVSPDDYIWGAGGDQVQYFARIGNHHAADDALRYWIRWLYGADPSALEMPPVYMDSRLVHGYTTPDQNRRQAYWDDHGEFYKMDYEGPDVYCTLTVPDDVFTLSLYEIADDRDAGPFRCRDLKVQIKQHHGTDLTDIGGFDREPVLAKSRTVTFHGGVYKQFLVRGPTELTVKICKNNSMNTVLSAVMLDTTDPRPAPYFGTPETWRQVRLDRVRNQDAHLTAWQNDRSAPAESFSPQTDAHRAAVILDAKLREYRDWNSQWWALNHRRLAVGLARWCQDNTPNDAPRDAVRFKATSLFEAGYYAESEVCQSSAGETTVRAVEKGLRWNGVTPVTSGIDSVLVARARSIPP